MLTHIFLDGGIQAARVGVSIERLVLVAEELPVLVQAVPLDDDLHGLAGIALDLDVVTVDGHRHGDGLATVVEHIDQGGLGSRALDGEMSLFVDIHQLVDKA